MDVVSTTHLTYCTNVHPGQKLAQLSESLTRHTVAVRQRLGWPGDFSVGLRLSNECALELGHDAAFERFHQLLRANSLYVVTLNGFPYGPFHGESIKEKVYLPDWASEERLAYTRRLMAILSRLLPAGAVGSISTVPGAYKRACTPQQSAIVDNLLTACADLVTLERQRGQLLRLALEPEPCCILETTDETIDFFRERLLSPPALQRMAELTKTSPSAAESLIRRHLAVCLDTCHAAVEFEAPLTAFERLRAEGITVAKVQVSSGLKLDPRDEEQYDALKKYEEPVYLHQVVARDRGQLERFADLPEAFAAASRQKDWAPDAQWRVHFHVPVFTKDCGAFSSTRDELPPLLSALAREPTPPHVEVETYTWDVLPEHLRQLSLDEAIAAELRWTLRHMTGTVES